MHISSEGKIGISVGLLALGGAGAVVVAEGPLLTAIGWASIAIAILGGAALAYHHLREQGVRLGIILTTAGTILIVFGGIVGLIGAFKMDASEATSTVKDGKYFYFSVDILNPKDLSGQFPRRITNKAVSPFHEVTSWFSPEKAKGDP